MAPNMEVCLKPNKNLAIKQEQKPLSFQDIKNRKEAISCCGQCDWWRGTCVLNINAPFQMFSASDKPCLEAKPRTSKVIPLSFPEWW